ncbi:MAG: NnrU family protein [Shimia sp.]
MTLLILGLTLWVAGHLWGRFAPGLYTRIGPAAKGLSALAIVAGVLLMIVGYWQAEVVTLYVLPGWAVYVNNVLMIAAFWTYLATATPRGTAWIVGDLRHPQLVGFSIWAVAHLLVNGDLSSVILFGGLLVWALAEIAIMSRDAPAEAPDRGGIKSPWGHAALVLVVFTLVAALHMWLGRNPFG